MDWVHTTLFLASYKTHRGEEWGTLGGVVETQSSRYCYSGSEEIGDLRGEGGQRWGGSASSSDP